MFSLTKMIVLFSVALSVAAVPSHIARNSHAHREIAARAALPDPVAEPAEVFEQREPTLQHRRRRARRASNNGRCKPGSSAVVPSSTPGVDAPPSSPNPHESSSTPKSEPSPTSSSPPQNSNISGGGSALSKLLATTFTGGDGTYYATGLGACGITNKDTDFIAAVSEHFFDVFPGYTGSNPNKNGLCGRKVRVEYQGKSITVTLTDRCTACAYASLDFSPSAFNALADPAIGRIHNLTWRFI